jgi:serine protease AprX
VVDFNASFGEITVLETNDNQCEGELQTLNTECNLSLSEYDFFDFKVYPNPTSDVLNIVYGSEIKENVVLTILDEAGRQVFKGVINQSLILDVRHFARGSYTGIIQHSANNHHFKFVKL